MIPSITGHIGSPEQIQKLLDAGMQEVMTKPAQPLVLKSIFERYVFQELEKQLQTKEIKKVDSKERKPKSPAIIDWDACVHMCSDNPKFARELLTLFVIDLKKTQATLAKYYANKDTKALCDELHRLQGGVCYLKLPQLENAFKTFHDALKEKTQDPKCLEKAYTELQHVIQVFLEAYDNGHF